MQGCLRGLCNDHSNFWKTVAVSFVIQGPDTEYLPGMPTYKGVDVTYNKD